MKPSSLPRIMPGIPLEIASQALFPSRFPTPRPNIQPKFLNYQEDKNSPTMTIIIQGSIADLNDVIRKIVTERPCLTNTQMVSTASPICPISHVPITIPVRGIQCAHRQCFDLRQFLISQEGDQWICPICQIPLDFESIRFDPLYFSDLQSANQREFDIPEDLQTDYTIDIDNFPNI